MKHSLITLALMAAVAASGQEWAKQALAKSPRHHEWVNVKSGDRTVGAFVVYPEVKNKATSVVVIHEIFGMTDWVQMLADELAEAGYIAIAPDLLSGMGPNGGGTSSMAANDIGKAIRDLPPDQITADLNAVADYVSKLPAANGKVAVAGFCWGGSQSFRFATNRPSLTAAFVFYGSGPESPEAIAAIKAAVYGFYAGNDARIGATVPKTQELMKAAGKTFDIVTYDGSGHGFMRAGDAPPPAADAEQKVRDAYAGNKKARDEAWKRWKELLKKL
ncbi:MAG TPA: dienelactone hydrolase family protein [Thermoanaerobaculia bacterium]|jgi:carboxymethylenebutenolidase